MLRPRRWDIPTSQPRDPVETAREVVFVLRQENETALIKPGREPRENNDLLFLQVFKFLRPLTETQSSKWHLKTPKSCMTLREGKHYHGLQQRVVDTQLTYVVLTKNMSARNKRQLT